MESELPVTATSPNDVPAYRDRSTGLVIFGVIQILFGSLAGITVPIMAMVTLDGRMSPHQVRRGFAGMLIYAVLAAVLLTLGVGSIQKKRWARALTLVGSYYTLIAGCMITVLLTAVLSVAMRTQQHLTTQSHTASIGIMAAVVTLIIAGFAFFMIVVPLTFIAFYSRKDVEQTCRHRDPIERWTDRMPLPVLAICVVMASAAVYFAAFSISIPIFPFFGRYLTGVAASAGMLVLATLDAYLAIALFRLKLSAWWIAVVTMSIRVVSITLTLAWGDPLQAYAKLGWSDSRLQRMNANPIFHSHVILWWGFFLMLGYLGYLLWLKRYFNQSTPPPRVESDEGGMVIGGFIAQSSASGFSNPTE